MIINESVNSNSDVVKYSISIQDTFKVLGLPKKFKNVKANDMGNYNVYKLIGTPSELTDVLNYVKSKGVKPRMSKVTSADLKWYNKL